MSIPALNVPALNEWLTNLQKTDSSTWIRNGGKTLAIAGTAGTIASAILNKDPVVPLRFAVLGIILWAGADGVNQDIKPCAEKAIHSVKTWLDRDEPPKTEVVIVRAKDFRYVNVRKLY